MLSVADALEQILADVQTTSVSNCPLIECTNRILREDLTASAPQPPFSASAMDGYALRSQDLHRNQLFSLIGTSAAGHPFDGHIGPCQAVRIYTGAPIPEGADTILIQENAEIVEGSNLSVLETPIPGQYVRRAGIDFKAGDVLLPTGIRLVASHILLAAAANKSTLPVSCRPKVALLSTGNELVPPGATLQAGQIVNSNSYGLASFVQQLGGHPIDLGIARDSIDALVDAIDSAVSAKVDVLVTLGGASVGDHDLTFKALEKAGMQLKFHKIAMRPGKPLMNGRIGDMHVLGLPGNPVSSMVCAKVFLEPLLRAMLGVPYSSQTEWAQLEGDLPENGPRQHYMRATLTSGTSGASGTSGSPKVVPFENQDSSLTSVLANSDCLIVRMPNEKAAKSGDACQILKL